MRLILLAAMAPLLALAQYPNRPAAHAPAPFALGGPPPRTGSAARPPRAPTPIGGMPFNSQRTRNFRGDDHRSHRGRRPSAFIVGAPFYYSYGDYGNSIFDTPPEEPPVSNDVDVMTNLLGEQIQRLSAQVEQLRNEQHQAPPAPPASVEAPQGAPPVIPITVVLRNGQQIKVSSYAVMNKVFWDFSQQPARRIPVANIDVAASKKATEAAGAEFPELAASR
ncbi:MAG TPA: hypothetical protein VGK64_19955 [Bryobacteraceae bacterium]